MFPPHAGPSEVSHQDDHKCPCSSFDTKSGEKNRIRHALLQAWQVRLVTSRFGSPLEPTARSPGNLLPKAIMFRLVALLKALSMGVQCLSLHDHVFFSMKVTSKHVRSSNCGASPANSSTDL